MNVFIQAWYNNFWVRFTASILLFILYPLSLWLALKPLDHYVFSITLNDKIVHFIVFLGFAVLMDIALANKNYWLWVGLPLIAYGALIEVLQSFTPYRSFSFWDWVADSLGVFALWWIIKRYKNVRTS